MDAVSVCSKRREGSLFSILSSYSNTLPKTKESGSKTGWRRSMGGKELSATQLDFFESCRRGDILKVTSYIDSKKNKRPKTPLSLFRTGTPSAGWLVAIRDASSLYTPLHAAALNGHVQVCRILLDNDAQQATTRDKRNCIPLHLAAWGGHTDVVQLLIEYSPEGVDSLNCAKETPLHLAAQHGHAAVTRLLLTNHANPAMRNARGESPLDISARTGHDIVCQFLVAFCPELALQSAVDSCHTEVGRESQTVYPVHAAARHSHIQCLKVLREAGFDLDYVTNEGSALHVAAMFGQVEGCRFLIANGINPHIRDCQGRTVYQLLEEHKNQKASDLTQIIQSREGWEECAQLVEDYLEHVEQNNVNSSSDSGIDGRDYRHRSEDGDRDVIWKPLPRTKSEDESGRIVPSPCCENDRQQYRQSYNRNAVPDPSDVSISGTVPRRWNSNMYDPVKGTPRFPVTSPYTLAQHKAVDRRTSTMPCSSSVLRTTQTVGRGSILPSDDRNVYRNLPSYDTWRKIERNGTSFTYNPAFPYDNLPTTSTADQHTTTSDERRHKLHGSLGKATSFQSSSRSMSQNGSETLPVGRRGRPSLHMGIFHSIAEGTLDDRTGNKNGSSLGSFQSLRSDSLGLGSSITTGGIERQSTISFNCSTLGSSINPRVSTIMVDGRAPLALPEEMTGSTSASILSNLSPERETTSRTMVRAELPSQDSLSTDTVNVSMTSLTVHQVESPPSPNTSQRRIFSTLVNNVDVGDHLSQSDGPKGIVSPTATECSDTTVTSSCSLPLISQISSPSSNSIRNGWNNHMEESDTSAVRLRPETNRQSTSNSYRDLIDEQDEWNKIECIMSSFGSGICRESVFAADFENKVALYLRDRRSQAITLKRSTTLSTSTNSAERETVEREDEMESWLVTKTDLDAVDARNITDILMGNGFDIVDLKTGVLSTFWMTRLGMDARLQEQLATTGQPGCPRRASAAKFDYLSDWLCSLDLIEYLGNFVNTGFKSMLDFRTAKFEVDEYYTKLHICRAGHIARMMSSLDMASWQDAQQKTLRIEEAKQELSSTKMENRIGMDQQDSKLADSEALSDECATFSAHYLGSSEISNIDGTEESRAVMAKLKGHIRELSRIAQVMIEISIKGVDVIDTKTQAAILCHDISRIQIVCQDKRDLNCFTYISQDGDRYFCHVFCVLTADIATEVILMLGQTFELAYSMKKGNCEEIESVW